MTAILSNHAHSVNGVLEYVSSAQDTVDSLKYFECWYLTDYPISRVFGLFQVKSSRVRSSQQVKHITAIDIFALQCWYHTRMLLFVCLLSKLTSWGPRFDMQDENLLGNLGLLCLSSTAQNKKTASIIMQIHLVYLAFGLFVGILFLFLWTLYIRCYIT